jgi:tetratricopeptide (TPR) repeat protein
MRLVGIFVALALAAVAHAQDERTALENAREHMERGQSLYLQGRFEEAALEFEAAYEARPFAAFLYNEAVALERAGQSARAADLFERYLTLDPHSSDARNVRERITRLRELARDETAHPVAPEGTPPPASVPEDFKSLLSVRTNPSGATVSVRQNNRVIAQSASPFAYSLDQGTYDVQVEHPDFQTVHQEIHIEPGRVYLVIVEMSQGEFLGYLRVIGDPPGAQVFIDDRAQGPRGQTPFEAPTPVGHHRVWVERAGYQPFETELDLGVGEDHTVRADLARVEYGRLRVVANVAGSRVLVDGQSIGNVPFEGQVPAGPHRLRVESDGMKAYEAQLDIQQGQLTPVRVRLRPDVSRSGAIVTTIFGSIALAGGITLSILVNEWGNQVSAARNAGTLAADDGRLDQGLVMSIVADSAYGIAVLLGALALYQFLYDPLPPSEGNVLEARDWALLPWLDPRGGAGLGFGGRL